MNRIRTGRGKKKKLDKESEKGGEKNWMMNKRTWKGRRWEKESKSRKEMGLGNEVNTVS